MKNAYHVTLGERAEISYMSSVIHNATEFFNRNGIIPPVLTEYGVTVEILTDD